MTRTLVALLISSVVFLLASSTHAQTHPGLILTKEGVTEIQARIEKLPLLKRSLKEVREEVDADMEIVIDVPVPKDMAGGYTHERHKKHFLILQKAGVLYQITGEKKYAEHVRDVLLEYARQFPSWDIHPANRSYAPGKIFWQCLNDANWLVYMSQAYDCIYDFLTPDERHRLENNLFRPLCDHISVHSPQFFNRIHNHSTWGNTGVGMMGLVMNDTELVRRSLYGLEQDDINAYVTDDDGGLIKLPGQTEAGFLAQIENAFSPEGYYTEGPYYQRYAMYPFLLFAQALENLRPSMEIFAYRDSVLKKAVYVLLNLTTSKGEFFPINDAQKGMSWLSRELVSSVNIIYHFCGKDPELLSIAKKQGKVMLDDTGLSVAQGLNAGSERPFVKKSMELGDGKNGDEGGLGILRAGEEEDELCLVMKYTSQGLSHGHYDKLSFMLFDKGEEVIQDYGLARFVNIDQKYGGGYLPENTSWAKQTIAHNTVTVNQVSHFKGDYLTGMKHHSERFFFNAESKDIQIASAKESNAYSGVIMHRTMAVIKTHEFEKPLVLDVVRIHSEKENQYDLPFWFIGQVMLTTFTSQSPDKLIPLGTSDGYQHLWLEGSGKASDGTSRLSWFSNYRFYTLTTVTSGQDSLLFTRVGANDPNFNLRRDAALMIRKTGEKDAMFVSILEPHGQYDPVSEIPINSYSSLETLEVLSNEQEYTAVSFEHTNGSSWILVIANQDNCRDSKHHTKVKGKRIAWKGPYYFDKL